MAFRDILVHADNAASAGNRLETAARLALAHGAHLVALHIRHRPFIPADVMATGVADTLIQLQREQQNQQAEETKSLVCETATRVGINIEWRDTEGDIDETLMLHGYYGDLIVTGRADGPLDLNQPFQPDAGKVVIAAGRPVLILPRDKPVTTCGETILIAWKASAHAARAIADAMPMLQKARSVTLLEVNDKNTRRLAGAEMATHLSRHGVKVMVESFSAPESEAGPLVIDRAADLGADLIVMGGYGYPRMWETVFGGVTRHVLENQFLPVLMSH